MIGLRAPLVALFAIGLAAAQAGWLTGQFETHLDPTARRYAAADLVKYYEVDPERGVRLKIPPDTARLKLITHGILAAGDRPLINEERAYGLRLRLHDLDGNHHWQREVWLESRQSVSATEKDLRQNAFLAQDDPRQLTDDRLMFLNLETPLPRGGILEIHQAPTKQVEAVVMRAYAARPRHPVRRRLQAHAGMPEVQAALDRLSLRPWGRLDIDEREQAARDTHVRVHALGRAHLDFRTRPVWYTGNRVMRMPASVQAWPGFVVSSRRRAAINVIGPFTLTVTVRSRHHADALPAWSRLQVTAVDGRQESPLAEFQVSPDGASLKYAIKVPGGAQSLHFSTEREAGVEVDLTASTADVELLADRPPVGIDEARVRLLPDERVSSVPLLHKDGWLAHYQLAPNGDPRRVIRVDTRRVGTTLSWESALAPDDHELAPTSVQITWLDAQGDPLVSSTPRDEAPLAPFESVAVVRAAHHVSEPTTRYLVVPDEARTLLLGADAPVVARVYASVPEGESLHKPPYAEVQPTETRWRYAPPLRGKWFPINPDNRLVLEETGQWSTLRTQVRLEPYEDGHGDGGPRRGTTLDPVGWTQQRKIIEPIGARTPRLADFDRFLVTRVWPNRATPLRFLPRARRAARVHYRVAGKGLGRTVEFVVDGAVVERTVVRASAGTWKLPPIEPGEHSVEIRGPKGLELYVDKPPKWSGGKSIHAVRTVHRLSGEGLAVDIQHRLPETRLGAVVYAPEQAGVPDVFVESVLDGGRPPRSDSVTATRHTTPERRRSVPPATNGVARFLNHRGPAPGRARSVGFPIWDDVRPGRRRMQFRAEGRDLWVRFYVLDRTSAPGEQRDVSLKTLAEVPQ